MIANIEPQLVDMARIAQPVELRKTVDRMVDAFDGDGGAASDADEFAKNHLTFEATFNGRFEPHGSVDAESGEITRGTEAGNGQPPAPNDTRTGPKPGPKRSPRSVAGTSRLTTTAGPKAAAKPPRQIITDLTGGSPGTNQDLIAAVRPKRPRQPPPCSTPRTAGRDCKFSRIITDGPSQILDVGRATRVVSIAMWNALVARDKHCQWAGCTQPPGFCEAHHIVYWTNGGPTNLANLKLLCWHHHRQTHAHDPPRRA